MGRLEKSAEGLKNLEKKGDEDSAYRITPTFF